MQSFNSKSFFQMKKLLTLFLFLGCLSAYANNKTFSRLNDVNKCWSEQKDVDPESLPAYTVQSEREWIRTHLMLVEQVLRKRTTTGLSQAQLQNRMMCLNNLHTYWQEGNFPINEDYSYRTPIFIDKHNNFCAVGYLVKASGHEQVSRMIASKTNLAYVREMHYPELDNWAREYGFTKDELAWIQPGYPPPTTCAKIGNGVEGVVSKLYTDATTQNLYVGGSFTQNESAATANNIAYVTEAGGVYTWHNMAGGVNGPVYAITRFDGKIFVGGSFTEADGTPVQNVAYWDGSSWHSAGCVMGTVKDFLVVGSALFVVGDFSGCISVPGEGFAAWNGSDWEMIDGLTGHVNTATTLGSNIVLGGTFTYGAATLHAIQWNSGSGFTALTGTINNEVMDLAVWNDTLYAACKRTDLLDTTSLLLKFTASGWTSLYSSAGYFPFSPYMGTLSFNTLCNEGTILDIGGNFGYDPMIGTVALNAYALGTESLWALVDSAINTMEIFKGDLIMGGNFKYGGSVQVNGIAKRQSTSGIPYCPGGNTTFWYPNPVASGATLFADGATQYTQCIWRDLTGRQISNTTLPSGGTVAVPGVAPGLYLLQLTDANGAVTQHKISVK